ncbi:KMT2D methyltransferase, partial [Thinocorus orbignyianus]|nr:KMT2D methyltransferase [Thinocorus orbignyianus]
GDEGGPEAPALRPRPDILNEISNLSQGDTSSSFPGSEPLLGSPDPEGGGSLSLELGPASADASLQKEDGGSLPLGAETDDSLLFEPAAKGDGDKSRRRSSPGRSRVKQVAGEGGDPITPHSWRGSFHSPSPAKALDPLPHPQLYPRLRWLPPPHPQITKVMLLKGWRCVECIVCEVCGKASDPARLLLCDDCDISYHTYCLDPPLQTVPKGGWKCKWCVCCVQCGAASPGFH